MEVEPLRNLADVKRMYNWLNANASPREAECFLIGCNVALRAGDLLSLRFDQMHGTHVVINEQKTGKRRQFPITKIVRQATARLKAYYESKNFEATYLFQSTSNRAKKLCQPICIQWLGLAYERGEDILYIQALLNHSHQHVTLRYIGVTKTAIEQMYHDNALEIA